MSTKRKCYDIMRNNTCKPLSALIVLSFALLSCVNHRDIKNEADFLSGKTIRCLDSLIIHEPSKKIVLLICSPFDCQPCLDVGFGVINELEKMNIADIQISVVGVLSDPSPLQERYKYYKYLPFDADDNLRRELKFVPTPCILVIDTNCVINKWIRLRYERSSKQTIEKIINTIKSL